MYIYINIYIYIYKCYKIIARHKNAASQCYNDLHNS